MKQIGGGDFIFIVRDQRFEQSAGPRKVIENFLASDQCRAQATKQSRAPFEPDNRIGCFDLKESRESCCIDTRKHGSISA